MSVIQNVACTVCGCVCDDLTITVDDGRITRSEKACVLAEPWFAAQNTRQPPAAEVDGKSVPFMDAVERAVQILQTSRNLLIYGLSRSTTEGQRSAVALADRLRATIDTTASTGHAPSILALQQVGESTCSLGEVKTRADLIVYWGCDPLTSHPRHIERYSLPQGREGRHLVVVSSAENATARIADQFIKIEAESDWETLWRIRGMVKGVVPIDGDLGILAERMKNCRLGILFFGMDVTGGRLGHRRVEALLQLVTDLNASTRFYARRLRILGDVAGADSVLTWQTGYPFAVNFAHGYPRYNPGEFTGPEMLARGEPDACLLIGSETTGEFPPSALAHLQRIPIVVLESPNTQAAFPTAVRFTTAVYGVHRPGTAYRMDEIPIPLRILLPTDYPSDNEVLSAIKQRLGRE